LTLIGRHQSEAGKIEPEALRTGGATVAERRFSAA
jgi:hypothetical protein